MDTQTENSTSHILKFPPEILAVIFALSSRRIYPPSWQNDPDICINAEICLVCKAWLPEARAALYRSILLRGDNAAFFIRTICADPSLFRFVKHLEIGGIDLDKSQVSVLRTLPPLEEHNALFSLTVSDSVNEPALHYLSTTFPNIQHLEADVSLGFAPRSINTFVQFVSSFRHLRTLDVSDAMWGDLPDDIIEGPWTISPHVRTLRLSVSDRVLSKLLEWLSHQPIPAIQDLFMTMMGGHDCSKSRIVGEFVHSLGANLTKLTLEYTIASDLSPPHVDLSESTRLNELVLRIAVTAHSEKLSACTAELIDTISSSSLQSVSIIASGLRLNPEMFPWSRVDKVLSTPRMVNLKVVYVDMTLPGRSQLSPASVMGIIRSWMRECLKKGILKCRVGNYSIG